MELSEIDLIDSRNFVSAVPHAVVRRAPPTGAGVLARGARRARLLGRHQVRRLRHGQPRLRALLLGQAGHVAVGDARGAARAAAAHDAQHGPAPAHALPAPGEQGLHAAHGELARAEDPPDGRRHHRRRHREGPGRLRHRHLGRAPAAGHRRSPRRPPGRPPQHVRLVQPDDRTGGPRVPDQRRRRELRRRGGHRALRLRGRALRPEEGGPRPTTS